MRKRNGGGAGTEKKIDVETKLEPSAINVLYFSLAI